MTRFVNAYNRGAKSSSNADPLLHASPSPPVLVEQLGPGRRPRSVQAFVAVCGKQVRTVTDVDWRPGGASRRCPDCAGEITKAT